MVRVGGDGVEKVHGVGVCKCMYVCVCVCSGACVCRCMYGCIGTSIFCLELAQYSKLMLDSFILSCKGESLRN